MRRRSKDASVRQWETMNEIHVKPERGKLKKTWRNTIRNDMTYMIIGKHMITDRA